MQNNEKKIKRPNYSFVFYKVLAHFLRAILYEKKNIKEITEAIFLLISQNHGGLTNDRYCLHLKFDTDHYIDFTLDKMVDKVLFGRENGR